MWCYGFTSQSKKSATPIDAPIENNGVNCPDCLRHIIHLASLDTYKQALVYVTQHAPVVLQPDPEIIKERKVKKGFNKPQMTDAAKLYREAQQFLLQIEIPSADKLPENILGTNIPVYYANMLRLDLIDDDGEPMQERLDALQVLLDAL